MNPLMLGLITGAAFGAILMLSGLSNPRLIIDMLRLRDLRLIKLLATAIATGIVGIALLDAAGLAHLSIKPLHLLAQGLGGMIFGVGFALSGYCPGTSLAASAEGRRDAPFTVIGGLAGAGIFAMLYEAIQPVLIEPLSFGSPTLHSWLGIGSLWIAVPIGLIAAGIIAWRLRAERGARTALPPATLPATPPPARQRLEGHRPVKQR